MYFFRSLTSTDRFHALVFRAILSISSITNHVRISLSKAKVHIQNSQQKSKGQAFTFSPVSTFLAKKSDVSVQHIPYYSNIFLPFREQRAIHSLLMGILVETSY